MRASTQSLLRCCRQAVLHRRRPAPPPATPSPPALPLPPTCAVATYRLPASPLPEPPACRRPHPQSSPPESLPATAPRHLPAPPLPEPPAGQPPQLPATCLRVVGWKP
ncbi:hypothetical protein E2562_030464 [Oryza meyeriana var. granulata]|uniref:Uncharacterized protein n=1 Tax=Oryza meyeriana var. granulata TaxID=110450 RepID=A0A6G1CJS8_9ORYZ|nr:hypothetical protein E2562_030464 [Oryza meyeriana var. granulata]